MADRYPEFYWGKFRHFKGNDYYAYGLAHDQSGEEYVLYQQLYGNNDFWIRPSAMFGDRVDSMSHSGTVQRFSRSGRDRISQGQGADKIKALMEQGPLILQHSESFKKYAVSSISSDSTFNIFLLDEAYIGGYLTDYQLAKRMGYFLAYLNGKYIIHELPKDKKVLEAQKLIVDHESTRGAMIVSQIGAASIDLRIGLSTASRTDFIRYGLS